VEPSAPFYRLDEHFAIDLPGARGLFTTRRGGHSRGPYASFNLGILTDDDPSAVGRNRRRLSDLVDRRLSLCRQVHGTTIRRAEPEPGAALPHADGQVSSDPDVAPLVLVADCLPIIVATPGAVAVLHAGWRGLAGGIVANGVAALRAEQAGPMAAAIGPGAGGCCYEVGEEVHAAFAGLGTDVRHGRNLDLKAVARRELERAGVSEIHDLGLCTLCGDPALFFSHRRDGGITGRQAGVAWLN
jgi:polyphenol oxidase